MTMSLDAAAQVMREAMREKVKRHSLWYLVQGGVMILAGILALVYPVASSFAVVFLLGGLLIISGIAQGISLIDAREVPHFWLQLVSAVLSVIVGVLLIRHRGSGLLAITLLLLVYFMVEGVFEGDFLAHDTAVSELELDPDQRHRWDTAIILSLGQPSSHGTLAAGRTAWHSAHLRRGRPWLSGLAGSFKLTPTQLIRSLFAAPR
jgi:hypothetical protein